MAAHTWASGDKHRSSFSNLLYQIQVFLSESVRLPAADRQQTQRSAPGRKRSNGNRGYGFGSQVVGNRRRKSLDVVDRKIQHHTAKAM
jgi:hypothetical protein